MARIYIRGPRVGPFRINARVSRKGIKVGGMRSLRWSAGFTLFNRAMRKRS